MYVLKFRFSQLEWKGVYMNVKAVVVEKTSKAGKPYKVLQVTFPNGYVLETFLKTEQAYIIELNK